MYSRIGAILLAILSLGATSALGSESQKQEKRPKPEVQVRGPIPVAAPMIDFDEQFYLEQERIAVEAYLKVLEEERLAVEAYLAALEAERLANEQAARRRSTISVAQPRSGVTGVCGGATNGADQFISRESGGNPGVYNTGGSGAWGCYQLMPMHFADGGACSDMTYGAATPEQQAACASRLPLSAWGG